VPFCNSAVDSTLHLWETACALPCDLDTGRKQQSKDPPMTRRLSSILLMGLLAAGPAGAEMTPSLNFGGVVGLIDMPSGEAQPDGRLSISFSIMGPVNRTTLSFQISPRLSGSFRYTGVRKWNDVVPNPFETYYDRSFDLRYLVLREQRYLPSVTVGLQDFIGTGLSSAEYIAATKTFGGRVKVTAGLGWGRLGSYSGFGGFGTRPPVDIGVGGKVNAGQWFKGDIAPFGGIEWQATEKLTLKAEYSSDAYTLEAGQRQTFERRSPFNFGVEYQVNRSLRLGAYSVYGSEVGLAMHVVLNPKRRRFDGIAGPGPASVKLRSPAANGWSDAWIRADAPGGDPRPALQTRLAKRLAVDGMSIESLSISATTVQLRLRNPSIDNGPQAIGRAARALSHVMPPSVEVFEIVPVVNGMGISRVTIRRSDIEALEHAPGQDILLRQRVTITDAGPLPADSQPNVDLYPKLQWKLGIAPALSYFDPSSPVRADLNLRLSGQYELRPGLIVSGAATQKLFGNRDQSTRVSNSSQPPVRSDGVRYAQATDTALDRLTLAWYARPAENVYSRVTFGYLERMHAGVSAEVLWKPVDSQLALGAEVNYSRQRDPNGGFGFGYYDYGVATGHLSAYYAFGGGYLGQLDVGRYLAGDVGATLSMDREFANGWKVGAFATLTSLSAAEFGEGSFDKGIRITVPLNWAFGSPNRTKLSTTIRPITRDGGARLSVGGRLYDTIRDYHSGTLDSQWGRVWR